MFRSTTTKYVGVAALVATMVTVSAQRASADDVLKGAIGLAIICGVTQKCAGKSKTTKRVVRPSGISAAQRQQNRDVQSALNAFNFPVGTVDGSLGRKSRAAIGNYQAYMGWNPTGRLDQFQRDTLVGSWNNLQYGGGNAYPNMMAREGTKGLLRTALNPQYPAQFGDNVQGGYGQQQDTFAGNDQGQQSFGQQNLGQQQAFGNDALGNNSGTFQEPLQDPNQTFGNQQVASQGQIIDERNSGAVQPIQKLGPLTLKGNEPVSIASRCELVELTTKAKGVIDANSMSDPNQALSEKFCDARDFSIRASQYVMSQVSVSENEMTGTCGQIQSAMAPEMPRLSSETVDGVLTAAGTVNTALGLDNPETAEIYGKICLGMGYRQDNAEMALAGAMLLTAAGKTPYSELVGHHVREGFGTSANSGASKPWYESAVSALEQGEQPAFEPSTTRQRVMVIRKAIELGGLRAGLAPLPKLVPTSNMVAQQN